MVTLHDRALLVRRTPFGESSLVVQACTRLHGRVHLIAKGAFRPTSRYYATLDWFDTLELEWSPPRLGELATLRAGSIVRRRATLPLEPACYRAAHAVLEQVELASRHEHADQALFDAAERALERLELGVASETLELARWVSPPHSAPAPRAVPRLRRSIRRACAWPSRPERADACAGAARTRLEPRAGAWVHCRSPCCPTH